MSGPFYDEDVLRVLADPTTGVSLSFASWFMLKQKARDQYHEGVKTYLNGTIPQSTSSQNHHLESVFVPFYAHRMRIKLEHLFTEIDDHPEVTQSQDELEYIFIFLAAHDSVVITRTEAEGLVSALKVIYPEKDYSADQVLEYAAWYVQTQSRPFHSPRMTVAALTGDTVIHTYSIPGDS